MANWYVDFSAANDGDGTAFGQAAGGGLTGAYNTLASKTFASGDMVWIRRKSITISATLTLSQGGAIFIGWPQSGDTYFSTRPSSAQASWDADAVGFAEITATTQIVTTMVSIATNHDQEFHRMKFNLAYTSTAATDALTVSARAKFFTCHVEHAGTGTAAVQRNLVIAANCTFKNSIITFTGAGTTATSFNILMATASTIAQFLSCTISNPAAAGTLTVSSTTAVNSAYFINCSFTRASTTATSTMIILGSTSDTYMYNCTVDDESTGAATQIAYTTNTTAFYAVNLTMNKGRRVNLPIGGIVHFARFNQTIVSSDYAINMQSGALVTGSNFTFMAGNTSGDVATALGGQYVIRNCSFASFAPLGSPTDSAGSWFADYDSVPNDFRFMSHRGIVATSNVVRTGGETYSLKCEINNGLTTEAFWRVLHFIPTDQDIIWAPLPASISTVTIYGYHRMFGSDPPTNEDMWFDLDYLDASTGGHRAFASSKGTGTLTSDSSTWTGDSSMTKFKMAVTITPGQACMAPVKIYLCKRVASAYVVIDPKPVIS